MPERYLSMDRAALLAEWSAAFGGPPPSRARLPYLRSALAYRLQEGNGLRLSRKAIRALERAAVGNEQSELPTKTAPRKVGPGARLLREWNGETYEVAVLDKGYAFEGRLYSNLSAIAREITGTRWSGPRFFGLTKRTP